MPRAFARPNAPTSDMRLFRLPTFSRTLCSVTSSSDRLGTAKKVSEPLCRKSTSSLMDTVCDPSSSRANTRSPIWASLKSCSLILSWTLSKRLISLLLRAPSPSRSNFFNILSTVIPERDGSSIVRRRFEKCASILIPLLFESRLRASFGAAGDGAAPNKKSTNSSYDSTPSPFLSKCLKSDGRQSPASDGSRISRRRLNSSMLIVPELSVSADWKAALMAALDCILSDLSGAPVLSEHFWRIASSCLKASVTSLLLETYKSLVSRGNCRISLTKDQSVLPPASSEAFADEQSGGLAAR
mmetsp:Transcript_52533/g.139907  ORF Transcript_52533/g.139907 Transcript_52533/m.139907 type:complete len:299 (+) Transcript_52533:1473-2369(+)